MDLNITNPNKCKKKLANNAVSQKEVDFCREENEELKSLLPPQRGRMSTRPKNLWWKVQWNDRNGNKLAEVFEFQPRYLGIVSVRTDVYSFGIVLLQLISGCNVINENQEEQSQSLLRWV
ncbi:receptor-like cytosolic serine/threonine-protein kinase RBK2 isoform X1 [Magnolia sinica]|uniref:receptor-like cytosolic serine/threonine-protein kinase RBK2 isoform X1 n=1 Tax=Magnolia sinica TaxID=86752 RepID=UPI0026587AF4|nr:receptor-like cytosolic serine/threonine-protein kinase RBK2 isoform X1 [Magnolia sinica]